MQQNISIKNRLKELEIELIDLKNISNQLSKQLVLRGNVAINNSYRNALAEYKDIRSRTEYVKQTIEIYKEFLDKKSDENSQSKSQ